MTVEELVNSLKEKDPSGEAKVTLRNERNFSFLEIHRPDRDSYPIIIMEQS